MGNPFVHYAGDESTPCWSCANFEGLYTQWRGYLCLTIIAGQAHVGESWLVNVVSFDIDSTSRTPCADRGRFTFAAPDRGCRHWVRDESVREQRQERDEQQDHHP
jgi:hypothetical protein